MKDGDKFYVVTRNDLKSGYQAVQASHALLDFTIRHPRLIEHWNEVSNYLCMLSVENEQELLKLQFMADEMNILNYAFVEPDIGNQVTAIAFEPGEESQKLLSKLSLALKGF